MKQLNTTNKAILVLCWFACLMNAIFFLSCVDIFPVQTGSWTYSEDVVCLRFYCWSIKSVVGDYNQLDILILEDMLLKKNYICHYKEYVALIFLVYFLGIERLLVLCVNIC